MSNERDNIFRADLVHADLWPCCPSCGDFNEPDAEQCTACGAGIYSQKWRKLSTRSTDLSPTERAEASGVV